MEKTQRQRFSSSRCGVEMLQFVSRTSGFNVIEPRAVKRCACQGARITSRDVGGQRPARTLGRIRCLLGADQRRRRDGREQIRARVSSGFQS